MTAHETVSSKLDGLLEEYKLLRGEIEDWSRIRNQFLLGSLAATGVIVAAVLQGKPPNGWAFLVPLVLWVPCAYVCAAERQNILTISGYIRVFIEPRAGGLMWEGCISKYQAKRGLPGIKSLTAGLILLQVGIMILLFLFAFLFLDWRPFLVAVRSIGWRFLWPALLYPSLLVGVPCLVRGIIRRDRRLRSKARGLVVLMLEIAVTLLLLGVVTFSVGLKPFFRAVSTADWSSLWSGPAYVFLLVFVACAVIPPLSWGYWRGMEERESIYDAWRELQKHEFGQQKTGAASHEP